MMQVFSGLEICLSIELHVCWVCLWWEILFPFSKTFGYHPRFGRTKKEKLPQYQGWEWGLAFVFYGQHLTKASVWDCVWAFSGQDMLFEESLGRKRSTSFGAFGLVFNWWFRGWNAFHRLLQFCTNPSLKNFPHSRFRGLFFRKSFFKSFYSWKIIKEYHLLKILSNACIVWERLGKALFPL